MVDVVQQYLAGLVVDDGLGLGAGHIEGAVFLILFVEHHYQMALIVEILVVDLVAEFFKLAVRGKALGAHVIRYIKEGLNAGLVVKMLHTPVEGGRIRYPVQLVSVPHIRLLIGRTVEALSVDRGFGYPAAGAR